MPTAEEDFDLVLKRCRERLAEIHLTIPALDAAGARTPPPPKFDLGPLPPPPKPAFVPVPAPAPAPAPVLAPTAPEPAPAPAASAPLPAVEPVEDEADDEEPAVFPPPTPGPARPVVELTPTPRPFAAVRWSKAATAGTAAVLLGGALALALRSRQASSPIEIPLARRADAIIARADRPDLQVASGTELLTLSRTGEVLRREPLEEPVADMDMEGGALWTVDGKTPTLAERRNGARPVRYDLNHVPTAVVVQDRAVWTADRPAHALHQYLISRSILGTMLQPLDRVDLPGYDVESFGLDADGTLWVVDARERRLVRLKSRDGSYRPADSAPLSPVLGPQGSLRGLFVEPAGLWLAVNGPNGAVLRRFPASSLDWEPVP